MRVITLNDDEALINYAKPIVAELRANMVRVDADFSATLFKAKIASSRRVSSSSLKIQCDHGFQSNSSMRCALSPLMTSGA